MEKSISEAIKNENGNYLMPFLWVRGEEEAILREEIQKIAECGIYAFCVEGRPHPDYCNQQWWDDLRIIFDEAKKHGMKVWILDDAHFPTGYANGIIAKKYPEKSKQYLKIQAAEVAGPLSGIIFDTKILLNLPVPLNPVSNILEAGLLKPVMQGDDSVCAVIACKVEKSGKLSNPTDLTANLKGGVLHWDVPAGMWKIYVILLMRQGGGRLSYINMLDRESARLQIEAVYEEHWKNIRDEFGKTLAGFFSDEAEIGNSTGYNFNDKLGQGVKALPYSEELFKMLRNKLGPDWRKQLPALWFPMEDEKQCATFRYAYMDSMTKLISRNFSEELGGWCAKHGVEYIGHVLEDNNSHSRMGCGMGHYFRAMSGQHMAGIDDIGNQVIFGGESSTREGGIAPGDGEFYHYALGKMGSSHAHIDSKKNGRTMCEIFGAYGWEEGTRLMKYLADHFLVRGVNNFVFHAFSPKFPDTDCPPHFYARGHNPMYRPMHLLSRYMNRVCHVFSNGRQCCSVAVLYHGESDWVGGTMLMQKPARELLEHQIDFDFVPGDLWTTENPYHSSFDFGVLSAGTAKYRALVIPQCEYLPIDVARFIAKAVPGGFGVYFINDLPKAVVGASMEENEAVFASLQGCRIVQLNQIAEVLMADGLAEVSLPEPFPMFRYLHYEKSTHIYMFSNEDASETFSGSVTVPAAGIPVAYDAYHNTLHTVNYTVEHGQCCMELSLTPYQSVIISMERESTEEAKPMVVCLPQEKEIIGPYKVSYARAKVYPDFTDTEMLKELINISELHPDFSGTIRYEAVFILNEVPDTARVSLLEAHEFAEVWLNGVLLGSEICPPYDFDCSGTLKPGENRVVLEVSNTLAHEIKSGISHFGGFQVTAPSGLLKNPVLRF
ncbi:MAG: glycosyl hydrolase [Anaerocolumna sp.]